MHTVTVVSPERGELWHGALPRVEAVEQWKTVLLRGRADWGGGGWVGGGHNHAEWAFSRPPEPARVAPERGRWSDQRGVARWPATEVMVVRIRL